MLISFGVTFSVILGFVPSVLTFLLSRLVSTFIQHQVFQNIRSESNETVRYDYYDQHLYNQSDVEDYFEQIVEFFLSINGTNPTVVRGQLHLTTDQVVKIYNHSVFQNQTTFVETMQSDSQRYCLFLLLTALALVVGNYLSVILWSKSAMNQIHIIKLQLFRRVLQQDLAWFDLKDGRFAIQLFK